MPLYKITDDDLPLMLEWRNSESIRQCMFTQDIIDFEHHQAWFERESKKETSIWLMYRDENGLPLGIVSLVNIDTSKQAGYWGFYTSPDAERGTGRKMCHEALEYFFSHLSIKKVIGEVLESNSRSIRFHKKLGFTLRGISNDAILIKENYFSVYKFELLIENWNVKMKEEN